jgi:hypothetical protein
MAILTSKERKHLESGVFGEPSKRAYPMPDRAHAANAKARASQEYNKGDLSKSVKDKIDAMANRILKKKK